MNALLSGVMMAAIALLIGCKAAATTATDSSQPLLMSGLEIPPIEFKSGMPSGGSTLEESLAAGFEEVLRDSALELKAHPHMRYELLGFTDSNECEGSQCQVLSLARATMVHEWMISHGVPIQSLVSSKGFGAAMPTGDNATEIGRSQNRRVELSFVPQD